MSDVASKPAVAPLIVGVGSSAGGLEALGAFLRGLPEDAPLGVVVIQHLDPAHESNLPELLSRQTPMKVLQAVQGALVVAGQIHVIPPSFDLRISGGRLELVARAAPPTPHLPVDAFFESLARDRGHNAAGVVLSGTGADGAQGVCALRRVGAATFAQDKSAQHAGMPEAAEATGCVDSVLSPAEIAAKLLEHTEDALVDEQPNHDSLVRAFSLLRRTSGIDFSSYKPSTLRRRIQRRAGLGRHPSIDAYIDSLRDDPVELDALAADMLIHVTSFFRDSGVFTSLSTSVLPKLLAEKTPGEQFRVWVPGCSTGEEVYSLVILLSELIADSGREVTLKVFGTDLSEKAIDRARAGVYPDSIEKQVSPGRLQRFFLRADGGYQVSKDVRDLCVFARQDITRDPPFSNIDLVSCRNLMIYLAAPVQRRVVPIFHYALRAGGILLLGASESPGSHPGFEPLDASHHIYRRTAQPSRAELIIGQYPRWPATPAVARPLTPVGQLDVQREADRAVLANYAPGGVVVTDDLTIVQFRGQTGLYLEPAPGTATLDLLRLAREELRVDLRSTLERARQTGSATRSQVRALSVGNLQRQIHLEVIPLLPPVVSERHFIVLFREDEPVALPAEAGTMTPGSAEEAHRTVEDGLRSELGSTRAYLQSVIEQLEAGNEELRAANEEVVSSNEELQSTNEELQTAKEELQATNEELSTVNDEMVQRNAEATRLNDDLTNVLNSVGIAIAILILGRDSRIRRFTPAAARLLNLIGSDLGRPFSDIKSNLRAPELHSLVSDVLEHLSPREQTITDETGRWFQLGVRPYLTTDRKVDGTVVTIVDIDAVQRGQSLLAEARDYAEGIVDTVREPLLVLDEHRTVRSANRSFYRTFQVGRDQVEGQRFEQLGEHAWVQPALSAALDQLQAATEARLEDTPTQFGGRSMSVSVRPLLRAGRPSWLLLAFLDLTEQMKADAAVRRSERAMREMLGAASEAILIAGRDGHITYANAMAANTFGYTIEELGELTIEALVPDSHRASHLKQREGYQESPVAGPMSANPTLHARRKDGTLFPAEVGLSMMEGEQGPLVVAFVSDISVRRESEARITMYKKNLQEMAFDAALVEERQRRRLAADLHDNIGQTLALAQIRLKAAQGELKEGPSRELAEGIKLIGVALSDTRELTFELSPPVLYDLGLPAAVGWLGEQLEAQHHLHVVVDADEPFAHVEDEVAGLLFRAVRELLTNVVKHAKATEAGVSLHQKDGALTVLVADQGTGFNPARLKTHEAAKGFGLFSVREQITRLGGTFTATSSPGKGTQITLQVPLNGRKPTSPETGAPP